MNLLLLVSLVPLAASLCDTPLEVALVVDGSTSILSQQWVENKKFLLSVVSFFSVSNTSARFSVVQFSSATRSRYETRLTGDSALLTRVLSNMQQLNGGTATAVGLRMAQSDLEERGRPGVPRMLILVTDGDSNGGDPVPVATAAKKNGTEIFAVGVGSGFDKAKLAQLVSPPVQDHLMTVADFDQLQSILQRLVFAACVSVDSVSPASGPEEGGIAVIVSGEGFRDTPDLVCRFGDTVVKAKFGSSTQIACIVPPGQGTVDVDVSFDSITYTASAATFTYSTPMGCPGNCNDNGVCLGNQCVCNTPWHGAGCDERSCPNDCSGHGSCNSSTGECSCLPGYKGTDCSTSECPSNCNGNGKCVNGLCECNEVSFGEACELTKIVCCIYCFDPNPRVGPRSSCEVAQAHGPQNSLCQGSRDSRLATWWVVSNVSKVWDCIFDGGKSKPRSCMTGGAGWCDSQQQLL